MRRPRDAPHISNLITGAVGRVTLAIHAGTPYLCPEPNRRCLPRRSTSGAFFVVISSILVCYNRWVLRMAPHQRSDLNKYRIPPTTRDAENILNTVSVCSAEFGPGLDGCLGFTPCM
ncbi:unnamed protein product [Sphacelaria rigidula]